MSSAIKTAVLALASTAIALGAAELALRASGRFPAAQLHSVSAADAARIPGPWEPGQDFRNLAKPELPHHIATNALGLRGPEARLEPGVARVLCLGDSFTFGDFVDDEQTLPAQLGARLAPHAEVLNGGVGGTTIVDQRVFAERLLALEPDAVLLLYSENDLDDLLLDPPVHVELARNRALKGGAAAPLYRAVRDTVLFHLVLRGRAVLRNRQVARALGAGAADAAPGGGAAAGSEAARAARYAAEARALHDTLRDRGAALVVAAFPSHHRLRAGGGDGTIPAVRAALSAEGLELVDLTLALRASGLAIEQLYLLPHDGHPTPRGYAIAARALAPVLRGALEERAAGAAPGGGAGDGD